MEVDVEWRDVDVYPTGGVEGASQVLTIGEGHRSGLARFRRRGRLRQPLGEQMRAEREHLILGQ